MLIVQVVINRGTIILNILFLNLSLIYFIIERWVVTWQPMLKFMIRALEKYSIIQYQKQQLWFKI